MQEAPLERILIQIVSAISCVWNIFCRKFLFQKVQTVKNPVLMHFCCILDVVFSQRIHREQRCILPFITVCPLQNLCFIDPVICIDFAEIPIWDLKKVSQTNSQNNRIIMNFDQFSDFLLFMKCKFSYEHTVYAYCILLYSKSRTVLAGQQS